MDQKLIVFLKYPEKGKVKTRLAQSVGADEATCVYKNLAEATVHVARTLAGRSADVTIAYDPPEREAEVRKWLRGPFEFASQGNGDLGRRLSRAVHAAFRDGAEKIVVIGTDCPDLDAFTIHRAFWALSRKDVVIGPSEDGGYYLIGLKKASHAFIFDDIPWSGPDVLPTTVRKIEAMGLSHELLFLKYDVDTIDDLYRMKTRAGEISCDGDKISVIIPAWNEGQTIEAALMELTKKHHPDEILVVDGGSSDRTAEIASRYAKVVHSEKGRASQMNAAAVEATGDILLFLHADTRLPDNALMRIRSALKSGEKRSGRFRMKFGHSHPILRLYEYQTRFHFFSYGDQGFFVTKDLFRKMGGFSVEAPFEDIDLYHRLLKIEKPVIIKDPVVTSPRRFLRTGIIKQKLINIALAVMYYAGLNKQTIGQFQKKWYGDIRGHADLKGA